MADTDVAEHVSGVGAWVRREVDVLHRQRGAIGVDAVATVVGTTILALDDDGPCLRLGVVVDQVATDQHNADDGDEDGTRVAVGLSRPHPTHDEDDDQQDTCEQWQRGTP